MSLPKSSVQFFVVPIALSIADAAKCVGMKPRCIEDACRDGDLPFRIEGQSGRTILYEDLRKWYVALPVKNGTLASNLVPINRSAANRGARTTI